MQDGEQKEASINAKTSFEGDLLGIEYSPDETVFEILPTSQIASFGREKTLHFELQLPIA